MHESHVHVHYIRLHPGTQSSSVEAQISNSYTNFFGVCVCGGGGGALSPVNNTLAIAINVVAFLL